MVSPEDVDRERSEQDGMFESVYLVEGMSCEHCVGAVAGELTALPGVTDVDVDLASGEVRVVSEAEPDDTAVRAAVHEAGYEVRGFRG